MSKQILEFLDSLMAGRELSAAELDEFLSQRHAEKLHIEYKHAKELEDNKKAAATLRQYMSGFANSAGGILMIGIDESNWEVSDCKVPGGGDLAKWASDCLVSIAAYFSPTPRFTVINHPKGKVLVASTARSLGLVPCYEGGRIIHYFRFHDKTLAAPEYLVSDLVLGKRQNAVLQVLPTWFTITRNSGSGGWHLIPAANIKVENQSLSWAEDIRFGLISWDDDPRAHGESLSQYLLSYLELRDVDKKTFSRPPKISNRIEAAEKIEPFQIWDTHLPSPMLPVKTQGQLDVPYKWKAAAYLLARGAAPIWFQVSMNVDAELLNQLKDDRLNSPAGSNLIEVKRLFGSRPIIAWECP